MESQQERASQQRDNEGRSGPQPQQGRALWQRFRNTLLVGLGVLCLVIAAIGVVVPFLPTVDFLLLAAWCFYRGSPRLHRWLLSLRGVGPIIQDWETHRVIRRRGKAWSVGMLSLAFGYVVFWAEIRFVSRVLMGGLWVAIAAYILTRPSRRPDEILEDGASGEPAAPELSVPSLERPPDLSAPRLD